MNKTKQIENDTAQSTLHLPMGQLFYLLYSNGFSVKPDDYIEMLKITERFGSKDIDETARWICPIIATSETEQIKFYHVIDQYKKLTAQQANDATGKNKIISRRAAFAIALSLAGVLALIIYLTAPGKVYQFAETSKEATIEKGDSLYLDASNLLQNHPEDTANIQFAWQFEDSNKTAGVRVTHVFNKAGDYLVKRHFTSGKLHLPKKSDSLLVHVCNDLPKLHINIPATDIAAQQPVTITASVDAEPGTVSFYQWTINDSVFRTKTPLVENIVFDSKGDYNVQCKAVVDTINSPCTVTENENVHVQDNGLHYTASFSPSRNGTYEGKTKLKAWVSWLLLLPAAGAFLYSVIKRKSKPLTANQNKQAAAATKGPYDIPFEQNDTKLIQQERDLRRTLIQMRYKAEEETLVLSVPATISSIIRSGGSPQLVYAPLTQQQQYLILIDRSNPKNMLTRLSEYLVKTIADDGIPVTSFHYDKNFVCYNSSFPGGLTLQRLAETYSMATLIMLGKAHEMVYSAYPVIEEKMLRELNRWQNKAIVTPIPVKDWGIKEKILQNYLILVPADTLSLQKIIPALREKIKPNTHLFEITETDQYSLRDTDFRDTSELRSYLNNDETMFQWLCAICIYPRLKWEVLVETGKAILDKYGEPEKLNYTNLLKLCRISWMQQGVFPQTTRLELLKLLTIENEICAREQLLRMLNYSTSIYGENGHFFEEEKKRQQLTNQFVLHANDSERYQQYANSKEAFKKMWKKDAILDMPVKKYLDKTNNDGWQTPVNNGNESVGLSAYFNLQEITISRTSRYKKIIAAAAGILLLGLWTYLGYGGGAKKLSPILSLTQDNSQQVVPVTIKVIKNFLLCGDTSTKGFEQMNGYLEINSERLPVSWDAGNSTASFEIPYKSIATGRGSLQLIWDRNKTITAPLNFANQRLPDSVTLRCINAKTYSVIPLQIRYNDTSGYKEMESTLSDALLRYKIVSTEQVNFTDSSRIIYYEPNQKPRADSVVEIIKQSLGINVKEEFISEQRTPPAVPILFLNTAAPDTGKTVAPTDGNDNADSYHRMGDQYFTDKQYQKAIREYSQAIILNQQDELAYYQRALCYEMINAAEKAIADYNTVIRMNSSHVIYYYRRASAKYSLKRYTDAIQDYNKVITMNAPEAQVQYNYSVYYRGRSYYYLNNLANACKDFKRSGDLGIKAGKQDYGAYCNIDTANTKPNCNKTFNSLEEALSVNAAVICKLDLSGENLATIPRQVYSFKNLAQLTLSPGSISQAEIDRLQKTLPACKIVYTPVGTQTETDFGYIELDQYGYTNSTGQQLMERVSRLLKAQPRGKIKLTATYITTEEQKILTGYMNTIVNMFAKIGVDTKTQIEQQITSSQPEKSAARKSMKKSSSPNPANQAAIVKTMSIHVTGINLIENQKQGAKKS